MTTTWTSFLADLRMDLQDTSATSPRWASDLLYLYTVDAIRDYSIWFPRRMDKVTVTRVDSGYPVPSDYIEDLFIESPENTYLERRMERPGMRYESNSRSPEYYVDSGTIYLMGISPDSILLTYFATHPVPSSVSATFTFTIPDRDIELPRLYVKAMVHEQMRGKQARLDRFDPGSGRRDDNPLMPETRNLFADYQRKIAERLQGKAIKLYRSGFFK